MEHQQTYSTVNSSNNDSSKNLWFWIINPLLFLIIGAICFLFGFYLNKSQFLGTSDLSRILLTDTSKLTCSTNSSNSSNVINSSNTSCNVSNKFDQVLNILQTKYVDKNLDKTKLDEGAIKGMVSAVGDFATVYYTKSETESFNQQLGGEFSGIGAELGYNDGWIIVKKPMSSSPAEKAGLLPGDYIAKVDDYNVKKNDNITDIVYKIRGKSGTDVKLTIVKDTSGGDLKVVTITRAPIITKSMQIIDEGNGIYRVILSRFTENSYQEFVSNWDKLVNELVSKNPQKLILDLRGNPGGFLDGAHYVAEDFLKTGTVTLYEADRNGISDTFKVSRVGRLLNLPTVVLVNGSSASAAEILTGALKLNNRAQVIGEKTFGKGTAQQVIDLGDGSSVHVTVQRWLLPDKSNITLDNPITPDVTVNVTIDEIRTGVDSILNKAKEILNK